MVREPESRLFGGGENDEGLSQGTDGLAQHDYRVTFGGIQAERRHAEAQHGTKHVQPGSQNHLQSKGGSWSGPKPVRATGWSSWQDSQ